MRRARSCRTWRAGNGLTPQQLFTWRRQARERAEAVRLFPLRPWFWPLRLSADTKAEAAIIEIVIGATTVRVPPGVDAATLKLVLRAVKAAS